MAAEEEDMIVNSTELGLPTKFIRPKSFNAYQCKGICSLQQRGKYIIHSLMKGYLEEKKGIKADYSYTDQFPDKLYPILDQNSLISIPYPRLNCLKTIPFTAAHTHIAYIWE